MRLFPDLPEVPDWLVELIPYRSDIGWLAFRTRGFRLCRVGPCESSYESVVLPRLEAERLQEEPDRPDHEYFRWIVPQWVLYGFARPLERRLIIWVLTDAHNRERWSRHRESPLAGEQSIDLPEGKYAGLEEVATEVELRPGWFVRVRRPPARGA